MYLTDNLQIVLRQKQIEIYCLPKQHKDLKIRKQKQIE